MELGGGPEERRERGRTSVERREREEARARAPAIREPGRAELVGRGRETAEEKLAGKPGYYGHPVIKPPVWTWEIPLYFFIGGIAGASSILALASLWLREGRDLLLALLWTASVGALLSPALLTADLKRPKRFYNMLRVFKWRSPMSMGAWILTAYGVTTVAVTIVYTLAPWLVVNGGLPGGLVTALVWIGVALSALFGALLATYSGVLIGATAVPVWHTHHKLLPVHFGAAGFGSAASLMLLFGFELEALVAVLVVAVVVETLLWLWLELRRHGAADRAAHEGGAGWTVRGASLLTGPISLVLLGLGGLLDDAWFLVAAVAFLVGSLLSRYGWLWAGRASAEDPAATFAAGPATSPPSRHPRAAPRR